MTESGGASSYDREKHFAAVGKIASNWSLLEVQVDLLALRLADIRFDLGACFTAQVSGMSRKFNAYMAVTVSAGSNRYSRRLNRLAENLRRLAERRNRIIHDPWDFSSYGPHRFEMTANKKLRLDHVFSSTEEVELLLADIDAARVEFLELDDLISEELASSPEKLLGSSP